MAFDPKKAYGTVVGHPWARYEQNGKLYGAQGQTVTEYEPERQEKIDEPVLDALDAARLFLRTLLAGGPLTKSVIYKEASINNQSWETVKAAADEIPVKIYKDPKRIEYWKLPTE